MFDFQGACRRGLGDRLARQQLGLYAQGQQQLAADRMRQVRTLAGRHPANGLPLQLAGGHIGMPLQRFVQALQVPEGRGGLDPVDLGVLEHGGPLFRRGHAAARGALLGGGQGQAQLLVQPVEAIALFNVRDAGQVADWHGHRHRPRAARGPQHPAVGDPHRGRAGPPGMHLAADPGGGGRRPRLSPWRAR
ncbi:hypothetical protein G6F32_014331 [Rhizopus arrhizus]|nr:hypothetical protein G6F32_014331 [Rhizopus arrhizus]